MSEKKLVEAKEEMVSEKPVQKQEQPKHSKKEYKLKTVSEKKNPLMKRTEYTIRVTHDAQATPTRAELTKELVRDLKVKEDCILVEKIFSGFGKAESDAKVFVYKDIVDIPNYKIEKLDKRMGKGAEKKKE